MWSCLVVFLLTLTQVTGSAQITVKMQENISAVVGYCAEIHCTFSIPVFIDRLQARWVKTNSRMGQRYAFFEYNFSTCEGHHHNLMERAEFKGKPENGDCSLRIKVFEKSDVGPYIFTVDIYSNFPVSAHRTSSSHSLLSALEKPRISGHGNLVAGQRARLNCSLAHSCPGAKPQLKWIIDDQLSITRDRKDETDIVSEGTSTWTVSSVLTFTPLYDHHGKTLQCAVLAKGVQNPPETITLDVKHRPEKPTINSSIVVMEGNSILLYCRSWGRPPVILRWVKSGKDIGRPTTGEVKQALHFVTSADDGEYWCLAENDVGIANASTSVSVHYKPKTEMTCTSAWTVTNCTCKIKANPPANISWSIDGDAVTELRSEVDVITWEMNGHMMQSSLNLTGLNRKGNAILCSAGNKHGYHTSECQLHSERTYLWIIHSIAVVVGASLVILMAVLFTVKMRWKRRIKAAAVSDFSVVYSAVVPPIDSVGDNQESCGRGPSLPTQSDEIVYAAINFPNRGM